MSSVTWYFHRRCLASILLTFAIASFGGCSQRSTSNASAGQSNKLNTLTFDGFQFDVPEGWAKVQPDRDKTVAMVLLNGTAWNNADGMIKVDVGKPADANPEATARALAGNDGQATTEIVKLDGTEAIRVVTASKDMSRPRHALVVFRDGMAFLIMAAGGKVKEVDDAFDQLTKSWRWNVK